MDNKDKEILQLKEEIKKLAEMLGFSIQENTSLKQENINLMRTIHKYKTNPEKNSNDADERKEGKDLERHFRGFGGLGDYEDFGD